MDPIAGVTPIKSMLEDLERKGDGASAVSEHRKVGAVWKPFTEDGNLVAAMERLGGNIPSPAGGQTSLSMPIALPKMPPAIRAQFEEGMAKMGMVPTAGETASSRGRMEGDRKPVVGGSLGVAYLIGDIRMAGVGTITHIEGQRMTGFGHPMMQVGSTDLPIVDARVITVRSSRNISVKMAATGDVIGQLTGDYQASVVGRYDRRSKLVPFNVRVRAAERGVDRLFEMQAAPMPVLLPLIVASGLSSALSQALPHALPYMYRIGVKWEVEEGYSGAYEDVTVTHGQSGNTLLRDALTPLILLLGNPFQDLRLKSLDISLDVVPQRRVAELRAVSVAVDEVRAGEELHLKAYLRPFGQDDAVVEKISIKIPRALAGMQIKVAVGASDLLLTRQTPAFKDLPTYIKALEPLGRADELVVVLSSSTATLDADGVLYPAAPPSLRASVSKVNVDTPIRSIFPEHISRKPTPWLLDNTATVKVDVLAPRS
tara:strand:- start:22 stop:1476 length:1455 start_codon:yes stop_codon:yes gene_type:complete